MTKKTKRYKTVKALRKDIEERRISVTTLIRKLPAPVCPKCGSRRWQVCAEIWCHSDDASELVQKFVTCMKCDHDWDLLHTPDEDNVQAD